MTKPEYDAMIEDCKQIIIRGNQRLGQRLLIDQWEDIGPIAVDLGKTEEQIEEAVMLAHRFPAPVELGNMEVESKEDVKFVCGQIGHLFKEGRKITVTVREG
jgi:hypothetical protein